MRRTAWGTLAMFASFLLGMVIALGSLISMRGRLDSAALAAQPLSAPTILVSCLDPLAILLEIVAVVLIVLDSKGVGRPHRRLTWLAVIFFGLWAAVNLGVFVPLSLVSMREGALDLFKAGQMAKAGAALFQYAIPFLLVYGLGGKTSRVLLWSALVLTVLGNFSVVMLPIGGMELEAREAAGEVIYTPRFGVDYTAGIYPFLLGLGYLGGALYMVAYGLLALRFFGGERAGSDGADRTA